MQQQTTRHAKFMRFVPTVIIVALLLCVLTYVTLDREPRTTAPPPSAVPSNHANDPYWQHARQEVYVSVPELVAQHQTELYNGIRYHKLIRGNPHKRQIALTFDDGPHPKYTPQLLKILAREKVKATFFVVGEMADKYPDLVRAEQRAGHTIGNHTYHHVNLTKILEPDVATEIKAGGEAIQRITGHAPRFFRPPGGDYDTGVAETSEALGYTIVLWTDDPGDYASPGTHVILQRTLQRAENGGIILIHDGIKQTIAILPQLIETLKQRGYRFVTVGEMMKERTAQPRHGPSRELPVRPAG